MANGTKRLYLGNLPYHATEAEVRAFFAPRVLTEVKFVLDRENGNRPRGFGFVECSTPEEAASAVAELDGQELGGRALKICEAIERSGGGNRGGRREDRGGRDDRDQRGGGRRGNGESRGSKKDYDKAWER